MTLYFWPPTVVGTLREPNPEKANESRLGEPAPLSGHEVRIPTLDSFIKIKQGAKNITVQGLAFHGCVGTALTVENAERCTVAACTIAHCGAFNGGGISIQGGAENRAVGNDISYTGSTGITLGGGDRKTLTSAYNVADNNHIHHIGVLNKNAAGIGLTGVGNTVSHNLIHNGPRMAVQFSGNNLVIENNRVHHMVEETQDGGAFYTGGRDWISSRGSVIRNNFITDTIGVGQEKAGLVHPFFTWGIYVDDNTGGVDIISNIVARSGRASLHLHNARDCVVANNIFVDGQTKQVEYDGWSREQSYIKNHMPTMVSGWESVKDEPAWKSMRGMDIDPRNAFFPDGTMMSGNVIERNIIAWKDATVRYVDFRHVRAEHNDSHKNVIWNGGQPVRTPVSKAGADVGDDLLQGSGSFTGLENGKTPKGWGISSRPNKTVNVMIQDGALSADAAKGEDPKNSHTMFHGPNIPIKTGAAYRVRMKAKANGPDLGADFSFGVFENGKGYWQTSATSFPLTEDWQDIEAVGAMPTKGEAAWKDWMKDFWLRVDVRGEKGSISIKDVTIHEAMPLDQWQSWQQDGWDKDSVLADPLFENAAADDYRLKKDSPAWKLGFDPIAVDKIGLYEDKLRASWPVKE
jgi:parallel beta-helix repeat protein